MIIGAVADPRIFSAQVVTDELTKREAIAFLRSIAESGLLIDDPDQSLLHESVENARSLKTGLGQRILLLLQELLTKSKKYCVSSGSRLDQQIYRSAPERELVRLAVSMRADAVVVSKSDVPKAGAIDSKSVAFGIVAIQDWSVDRLESHRRRLLDPDVPFDELQPQDREERIGRALKYAASIKVLDAYVVAAEHRASKFCDGISYIVSVWERWTLQSSAKLMVEVYTVGDKTTQTGTLTGKEAVDRLKRFILTPLQSSRRCVVSGFVKKDSDPPIFHPRFLLAKMRAYSLDPGFDAFDQNGTVRRCFFRLESAGERHVDSCVKLPNAS